MNVSDLETYEYQLSQIKLALAKDPTNTDYLTLKDELTSLIDLTKEYLDSITSSTPTASTTQPSTSTTEPQPKPKPSTSTSTSQPTSTSNSTPTSKPTFHYQAGQECLAKYSGDHKYYPCRITTVGGSDENRVFSIIFHGYEATEIVPLKDLKPLPTTSTSTAQVGIAGSEGKKRSGQGEDPEAIEKERKRKKYEKKAETQANKTQEQGLKQKSWQTFAKKGAKKGVVIPGIQGASMFKSPEDLNPQAKGEFPITFPLNARMNRTLMIFTGECTVGVVGSGRGMTKSLDKKKQSFV